MFSVYAIYNVKHHKLYIGQTENLALRMQLHREHTFKGYTSQFDGEWTLIYSEQIATRQDALKREKQLKSFRGREFVKKHIPG